MAYCFGGILIHSSQIYPAGGHKGDPNGYSIPKGVDLFISVSFGNIYEYLAVRQVVITLG